MTNFIPDSLNVCSNYPVSFFKEIMCSSLETPEKKIAVIASLVIGSMIAYRAISHYKNIIAEKAEKRPPLNLNDFISQCAPNKQAMIYGLVTCDYKNVIDWLKTQKEQKQFNDVFNYMLGSGGLSNDLTTFEGREICQIIWSGNGVKGGAKSALANIVIENVKRKRAKLSLIPVIFIVDKDRKKLNIKKIINKVWTQDPRDNITDAEIRRAYKLCFDPKLSAEIKDVAQRTFVFISLTSNKYSDLVKYKFTIRKAPWDSHEWQEGWTHRQKKPSRSDKVCWRDQVLQHTKEA